MKLYVASSWRNVVQPSVIESLREAGHGVYDFRNPEPGSNGFHWSEIDPEWKSWTPDQFRAALDHEIAVKGFGLDYSAMHWADAGVMVMPCGRSAHLEAGYFVGAGKPLIILAANGEPELMYKMANSICLSIEEVIQELAQIETAPSPEDTRLLQACKMIIDLAGCCPPGRQCPPTWVKEPDIYYGKKMCTECWVDYFNSRQDMQTCRKCGCTEDHACKGGCSWAEPGLCSACAEIKEKIGG